MKHLKLFKSENQFNEEYSMLPNPWVAYIDSISRVEFSDKDSILPDAPLPDEPSVDGEPSWISHTYEISRDMFTEYPTLTLVRGRGLVNAYKINGVEAEIEPEQIVTAEMEIFQPLELEGMTFYLPSLASCPYGADITTATTFTLNRPLDIENDWILMYEMDDSGMPTNMEFRSCADYGIEYLQEMFTISDDGMSYTYSEDIVGYWNAEMPDVRLGCFFIDAEYANSLKDGPMNPPTLTTSAVITTITGGVGDITIDESVLDSNNRCIVEYRIDDETKVFSSKLTSDALLWLKSVDYSQCNINRPCMIPHTMFSGATELESVVFNRESNIMIIGASAFNDCISLTSVTIPDSVIYIGAGAFSDCTSLTSVTIPDSMTSIGNWVFENCNKLPSIIIPNSVTSIGYCAFNGCSKLTNINIPETVTSIDYYAFSDCTSLPVIDNMRYADTYLVGVFDKALSTYSIKDGTKWIGDLAFNGCSNLTSITIPDSVTSIGSYAFSGCTSLTSVTIPDSVTTIGTYAFKNCTGLTSVNIPDSVTYIDSNAFNGCTGLTSVTIGNGVTYIGGDAFRDCTSLPVIDNIRYADTCLVEVVDKSLTTYTIKEGTKVISTYAFSGCTSLTSIVIPDSVTTIHGDVFGNCTGLTSVTIGNGVTYIRGNTFRGCTGLTSITIPDSVTSIGSYAFSGCTSLTSVTIPDSVTTIGTYAFKNCTGLTSVTIGSGITEIGDYTFEGCTSLTSINIPDSVTSIGDSPFYSCTSLPVIDNIMYADTYLVWVVDTTLSTYTIKDGTKWIGGGAFYECSGLTSINIPDSVTSIGDSAFYSCTSLSSITIPDSVTTIGSEAFGGCKSLTSINIPDSVTTIGDNAFGNCTSLTSITFNSPIAPTLLNISSLYDNMPSSGILYYPKGSDYDIWLAVLPIGWVGQEI